VDEKSNIQFLHIAKSDKPVAYYNLDGIISVGYRVNAKRGTQFRQWEMQHLGMHPTLDVQKPDGQEPKHASKRFRRCRFSKDQDTVENLIVCTLFALALVYLGNRVRKQFRTKNTAGCAKGCGGCGAIDFNKIEAQMAAKEKQPPENAPA